MSKKSLLYIILAMVILLGAVCLAIKEPFNIKDKKLDRKQDTGIFPKSLEVAGIIDSEVVKVDDFLKKENLTEENIQTIKEISNYSKKNDAYGRNYADISIVEDKNSKTFYFVGENSEKKPSVFRLTLEDQKVTNIFEGSSNEYRYDLLGISSGKLLFFKDKADTSAGPCSNPWVEAYEQKNSGKDAVKIVQSLNSLNPSVFANFVVPIEKYVHEVSRQEVCRYEFERLDQRNYE